MMFLKFTNVSFSTRKKKSDLKNQKVKFQKVEFKLFEFYCS